MISGYWEKEFFESKIWNRWKETRYIVIWTNTFCCQCLSFAYRRHFLTEIEIFTKFEISWKVILSENDMNLTSWENIMSSNMFRIRFSRTFLNFHERSFKFIKSSDSVRLDDYGNNNVKLHQKFPNYFRGNAFQIHEYSRLS